MRTVEEFLAYKHTTLYLLLGFLMLNGCAISHRQQHTIPPGFFSGLIHGFLIILSLIGSIFMDIRIYAFPNSGFLYDHGYLIGVFFVIGGAISADR